MNFRIIFLNCNSLCSKLSEIKNLVDNEKAELVCLTETWLTKYGLNFRIKNVNGNTDLVVLVEG